MAMKVTADELRAVDQTSIPLADGSGYLAEMAVYHELHCVVSCLPGLASSLYYFTPYNC